MQIFLDRTLFKSEYKCTYNQNLVSREYLKKFFLNKSAIIMPDSIKCCLLLRRGQGKSRCLDIDLYIQLYIINFSIPNQFYKNFDFWYRYCIFLVCIISKVFLGNTIKRAMPFFILKTKGEILC